MSTQDKKAVSDGANVAGTGRRDFMRVAAGATAGLVAGAADAGAAPARLDEGAAGARAAKGFLLPFANENYELGRRFVEEPERFLSEMGMKPADIACPPAVHAAFERSEAFSREVGEAMQKGVKSPLELTNLCRTIAPKYFGEDYQVAIQPYGLKFKERVPLCNLAPNADGTISGSFTVTYLDRDTDVDD